MLACAGCKCHTHLDVRFLQRVRDPVLLPFLRLRAILELLVQRCCIGCVRSDCRSARASVLDELAHMGHQSHLLGVLGDRERHPRSRVW